MIDTQPDTTTQDGGHLVGALLAQHGVSFLYTLCGGHIAPILVGADAHGVRVIDVRHEATAVFAADATARLTGTPGVAAVTAGPGVTNTVTALKNAQMAQSPVVLIGGAAATLLKGRGALQEIDHLALVKSLVKWSKAVTRVRDIGPALTQAFQVAQSGVPGPVFVEIPIDLLYPESVVRTWTLASAGKGVPGRLLQGYLNFHLRRTFAGAGASLVQSPSAIAPLLPRDQQVQQVVERLRTAQRPVLLIGSQALVDAGMAAMLPDAVRQLAIPTFLSGMARGLLGYDSLHIRHQRTKALREADLVLLAGVPCDFRLNYGRAIARRATYIAVNRSRRDLTQNRRPTLAIQADAGQLLCRLAPALNALPNRPVWTEWLATLQERDYQRDQGIMAQAAAATDYVNPLALCQQLEAAIAPDSVIIGDGGDFVATASYIVRPRAPLAWLDPGAFGTLGAGGGFALAAKLCRPEAEVWLLYGDGSAGYSLAEFDTFARHNVPVIAVVGNDAAWSQIAREQVEILGTPLGTELAHTDYHQVAAGYGGVGFCVATAAEVAPVLAQAKAAVLSGRPVLVNVHIGKTDFRKGSISM
ncbi:MAG: thiamine pyrophosphate-binding protein [Caldilineaceae bacterium]